MRILGLDYGEKRIGVVISDPLGLTAQPVAVIGKKESFAEDIKELNKIISKYDGVDEIVVGLPKTTAGLIGVQAAKVLEFIEALRANFKIKITAWDERFSSVEAERAMIAAGLSRAHRKRFIDRSAASIILQSYLDRKHK